MAGYERDTTWRFLGLLFGIVAMLVLTGAGLAAQATTTSPQDQSQASGGKLTSTIRHCPSDPSITPSTSLDTLKTQCQIVSRSIDFRIRFLPGA